MAALKEALQEAYRLELEELPREEALAGQEGLAFSPAFERSMKKLIRRTDHPVRSRVIRAAACFLLAAALGAGSVLVLVPEARAALAGWARDVYESWFVYRSAGEGRPVSESTVYYPAWVPEGYEEIAAPQIGAYVRTQYQNGAGELLTVSYLKGSKTVYGTPALDVEWESAEIRRTKVGRLDADLYRNPEEGPNILVWTDEARDAAFWIVAPLSEDQLVRVAESVRESEPIPREYRVSVMPTGGYWVPEAVEEPGRGWFVFENTFEDYRVTFEYAADPALAPEPETQGRSVAVGEREGKLYPAAEDGGDRTLIWTSEYGDALWICGPLPEEEMIQMAENVTVKINRYTDVIERPVFDDPDAPLDDLENNLLPLVEKALTEDFVAQVEDCARRDAQAGTRMSEEYHRLREGRQAEEISPDRETAIARVSPLVDGLEKAGQRGESIVSLFGPFYTACIRVDWLGVYVDICDERGVAIVHYNTPNGTGWMSIPTAEEMQFTYAVNQIYSKAYAGARAELDGNQ